MNAIKRLIVTMIALLISTQSFADVVSQTGVMTLKVIRSQDRKSIRFEELNIATNTRTRVLGTKSFYTLTELMEQRQSEAYDFPLSIV